jgi:SSS family solute:Na+ symporter
MTVLLGVCLVFFLFVGLSTGRSAVSRDAYFVASRRGTSRSIGGSLLATVVGASATVGVAGLAYGRGVTAIWWSLAGVIGLLVLAAVLIPRVRAWQVYTLPGLVGRMYGPRVAVVAAVLVVVGWMGVVSGQVVAAGLVLSVIGVGSAPMWMALFTAVLVVYIVVGGQGAILRTDVVQAVTLVVGIGAAVAVLLWKGDGAGTYVDALPAGSLSFPVSDAFGWDDLVTTLALVGSVYLVGPDIYTRLFSASDSRSARKAAVAAALMMVPIAMMVTGLGLAARVLAPGIAAEEALPWLLYRGLPPFASALLLAGLVAALMSSADSTLLGQAVVLADDVIARIHPLDDRSAVLVARVCVVVLGGVALVLALELRGVISSLMFAYSVFTSGVVGPVLLGLLGGRLRPDGPAALAGMCVGGALGLLGAVPGLDVPLRPQLALIGLGVSVLIPLAVTACRRGGRQHADP